MAPYADIEKIREVAASERSNDGERLIDDKGFARKIAEAALSNRYSAKPASTSASMRCNWLTIQRSMNDSFTGERSLETAVGFGLANGAEALLVAWLVTVAADGTFLVRVRDTRGQGGADYRYALKVRPARPAARRQSPN